MGMELEWNADCDYLKYIIDCGGTPIVNTYTVQARDKTLKMALESLVGPFPEDQKVLNLLKKMEKDCAGDNELAHASYELKALVSIEEDEDCTSILTDSYTALRQSEIYSTIALSLVYMIINHVMCYPELEPLKDLRRYVSEMPTYEVQVKIPKLLLRRSLAKIALDLTESEAEDFITVAAEELKPLNPDRLGKSPEHEFSNFLSEWKKGGWSNTLARSYQQWLDFLVTSTGLN